MRVLSMIKADSKFETQAQPDPAEMAAMGRMSEEGIKRGLLLDQGGLTATSQGVRVTFEAGKPTVMDGPFAETKELIAGFAILDVRDLDHAIEEAFKLPIKAELELRPIYELDTPEEAEFRAAGAKLDGNPRWMLLFQPHREMTEPPTPDLIAEMGKFNAALMAAGVLVSGDGLQPSVNGARIDLATRQIERGPFTNKYLLCGWWTIQCATKAEAVEWAKRVPIESGTIEVRQLYNPHLPNPHCNTSTAKA